MKYHRPQNLKELQQMLSVFGRNMHVLAGGTDLLVEARQDYFKSKEHVVDISRLPELATIQEENGALIIGAVVTHNAIVQNALVKTYAPLLNAACRQIGSLQIRNRGTIGGNVCNASPCADTVPPLVALQAELEILSPKGKRQVAVADFFHKPYQPKLEADEVLTAIRFKKLTANHKSAFYKLGRRNAVAISRINMAVILALNKNKHIREVRIAPGSVFPSWQRVTEAETFLAGKEALEQNFLQTGEIVARRMIEISGRRWSTPYKEPVVAALTKRTLAMALNSLEPSEAFEASEGD